MREHIIAVDDYFLSKCPCPSTRDGAGSAMVAHFDRAPCAMAAIEGSRLAPMTHRHPCDAQATDDGQRRRHAFARPPRARPSLASYFLDFAERRRHHFLALHALMHRSATRFLGWTNMIALPAFTPSRYHYRRKYRTEH